MPTYKDPFMIKHGRTMSFPSAFNKGGNHLRVEGISGLMNTIKYSRASAVNENDSRSATAGIASTLEHIASRNFGGYEDNSTLYDILWDESVTDGAEYDNRPLFYSLHNNQPTDPTYMKHKYENPFHFPTAILRQMNTYRFQHTAKTIAHLQSYKNKNGELLSDVARLDTTISMFNPNFNVQSVGIGLNVPLLLDGDRQKLYAGYATALNDPRDLSDCSIRTLVKLSNNGELGVSMYRFADFMYCKDLGKVSNNHLITLRKFPLEVGDHIGFASRPGLARENPSDVRYDPGPEVGHLVTWFGTEDNKLEDILKYSYQYTWKELNADRQDLPSKEDSPERGIIGLLSNFNPSYNASIAGGTAGSNNIINKLYSKIGIDTGKNWPNSDALERLGKYDNNKVYTPRQTIQDMYIPEGKLKFQHEFNLTFSYKLRAYENINPKSAFLDLLNNILQVTYFDGKFWGGEQRIIGPKPNVPAWRKANALIDNAFSFVGGAMQGLADGSLDFSGIMGMISAFASSVAGSLKTAFDAVKSGGPSVILNMLAGLDKATGLTGALKGGLKNALGRPSFYAFNSLLTGDDTGLWHVTIGNPRNPIVSFGNLIMTNASIQHSGPLGLDDFPTELKVTVTLKHARSRDAAGIGRMYTQGIFPLSFHQQANKPEAFRLVTQSSKSEWDKMYDANGNRKDVDLNNAESQQRIADYKAYMMENYQKQQDDYNANVAKIKASSEYQQNPSQYDNDITNAAPQAPNEKDLHADAIRHAQEAIRQQQEYSAYASLANEMGTAGADADEYLRSDIQWMMFKNGSLNIAAIMQSGDEAAGVI